VLRVTAFQGRWFLVEAFKDYIINYETGVFALATCPSGLKWLTHMGMGGRRLLHD